MNQTKQGKVLTALSLQGGGALGAYQYGVIKALYKRRGKGFYPHVVAGVSIGAINAALLVGAKGDPLTALDSLWREKLCVNAPGACWPMPFKAGELYRQWADLPWQTLSLFGNPGMYRLKPEYWLTPFWAPWISSSMYDTALLKETLAQLVDPEKLNRPEKTRLIVTAVNVQTGQQAKFDNAETTITLDHIIASGSYPVSFPLTPIDGNYYWDGGIFMNMPVGVAVNALEQIDADRPDVEREVILVSLHRMWGELPKTILEAAERFYELIFSGKFALDRKLYCKYDNFVDVIQQIDKILPADSPIRNHEGYKDLIRHRKIHRVIIIGEDGIGAEGSGSDFSAAALSSRIEAGFQDATANFKKAFPE